MKLGAAHIDAMPMDVTAPWNPDQHLRHPGTGRFVDMNLHSEHGDVGGVELVLDGTGGNEPVPRTPAYWFQASHLPAALLKIEQANHKLERAGIADRFTYTTESTVEEFAGQHREMVTLTLNRPSISLGGWKFIGAHDFTPTGHVVSHMSSGAGAAVPADNRCDHCGANRARTRVYTVIDPDGNQLQVGKSCLEVFTGVTPSGLWGLESSLGLEDLEELSSRTNDARAQVWDVEELLIAALTQTQDGAKYVSVNNAFGDVRPTGYEVALKFNDLLREGDTPARRKLARKVVAWAKKLDGEPGSYEGNLKAIFSGKRDENFIRKPHFGIAVSAVSAYHRSLQRAAEERVREQVPKKQGYLAAPKEKISDVGATVERVFHRESYYGYRPKTETFIVMRTDDGHVLTWNASTEQDVEPGQKIKITGASVKANQVYNDTMQTVLTRVKYSTAES